ncbi:MAG TPA: branched-chain amino acid ABC transporter permease [Alphaproteobacteria bacterium]|jgi:branched-chain amino acid transport system permease protein
MTDRREWVIIAALAAIALAVPLLGDTYYTKFATRIAIYGMAALAVDILLGYAGLVSFGHAAFYGVGAYAAGILINAEVDSGFVILPVAVLAAAFAALVIGAMSLRTSGLYFIMITLAFAQMLYYVAQSLRAYGGTDGFALNGRMTFGDHVTLTDATSFYYLCLALLVIVVFLAARMLRAEFGVVLRGSRDNAVRLEAIGFPSYRYKLAAFAISGGIAGLAGALAANLNLYVAPPGSLNWELSGELLVMVIFGAAGTLMGPIVGAAVYLFFADILADLTDHWMIIFGPILLLRVLFVKDGLYALLQKALAR